MFDRLHRYEDAAREFEFAATLAPHDPSVHDRLSRIYDHLEKPEAAAAARERHSGLVKAQDVAK